MLRYSPASAALRPKGLCPQEGFLAEGSTWEGCKSCRAMTSRRVPGREEPCGAMLLGRVPGRWEHPFSPTSCCSSHVHDSAFSLLQVVHSRRLGPSRPLLMQDDAQILCACLSKHLPCPGPALVRAELSKDYCHLCLHQNLC